MKKEKLEGKNEFVECGSLYELKWYLVDYYEWRTSRDWCWDGGDQVHQQQHKRLKQNILKGKILLVLYVLYAISTKYILFLTRSLNDHYYIPVKVRPEMSGK